MFGPPKDRNGALAVLREALAAGVDHIDTSDFYGPHITNQLIGQKGIAYVPFFPLGGFTPLQSETLSSVAHKLGATPMQVALAWLLAGAPNMLLIPGTSSLKHLKENLAAAKLVLADDVLAELEEMEPDFVLQ